MLVIIIFKWIFVLSAILLSFYHYKEEREKLNKIAKFITDPKLLSELRLSARKRMSHFFILFTAMIVWIMSYDIEIENVNKQKTELTLELERTSRSYSNTIDGQKRLVEAKLPDPKLVDEISNYYTDLFVNYYVMRKCSKSQQDDVFIINSAMMRELGLNNISTSLREDIIKNSKETYFRRFANFSCEELDKPNNGIAKNYNNYIQTVREVLKATF